MITQWIILQIKWAVVHQVKCTQMKYIKSVVINIQTVQCLFNLNHPGNQSTISIIYIFILLQHLLLYCKDLLLYCRNDFFTPEFILVCTLHYDTTVNETDKCNYYSLNKLPT